MITKGTLSFNLDEHEGRESMENALKANLFKMKIDTLYDEVFREIMRNKVDEYTEAEVEFTEKLWQRVSCHFEMGEE
jgi:hypothetical protein